MTKTQYLDMRGFDPTDWDVLVAEEASKYLEQKGAINNMYPVKESKAIDSFGKGAYIVKKTWVEKLNGTVENTVSSPPPPVPAPEQKSAVPAPPPVPQPPITSETETPQKSSFLKTRIANLEKIGYVDNGLSLDKGTVSIFYKDLEEMENKEYTALLKPEEDKSENVEVVKTIEVEQLETKDKRDLPWEKFQCDKFDNTGEACQEQCKFCRQAEEKGRTLNEHKEKSLTDIQEKKRSIDPVQKANEDLQKIVESKESEKSLEKVETIKVDASQETELVKEEPMVEVVAEDESELIDTSISQIEKPISDKKEALLEKYGESKIEDVPVVGKPMEGYDKSKFFKVLSTFGFDQLTVTINMKNPKKFSVIVKPSNFSGDSAFDDIQPLLLSGTVEELDEGFFKAIGNPLQKVSGLMANAKSFIEEAEAKEKETKAKKAEQEELKKDLEKAKKFYEKDGFDLKKSGATALKKFDLILEKDPKNTEALEYKNKIEKAIVEMNKKDNETLNLK